MSEPQTTEIAIGAGATLEGGCIRIPLDVPPGTVISVTITIGGAKDEAQAPEPAPQRPRHIGGGRAINGGAKP
jgi:hypothetical protein